MRHTWCAILIAAMAGCSSNETDVAQPVDEAAELHSQGQYRLVKVMDSLGGVTRVGTSINNRGWVAGFANLAGNATRHAALWRPGQPIKDLLTLGGPNSLVVWPGLNDRGMIVGIAETAETDSLGESWSCTAFLPFGRATGHVCRGFFWDGSGPIQALPTFGGTHGFATEINNKGQAVGWAETLVYDPTCDSTTTQKLQFRAALWEPKKNRMIQLRPYGNDSVSSATAINDRGQVVGISGECDQAVGRGSARHAVMWEHGKVKRIGDLGGNGWHTPMDINEEGDVTGFSNPEADREGDFVEAFFWSRHRGVKRLGKVAGHDFSQAFGINNRRTVVGRSCGANGCVAVIWQGDRMTDLNTIIDGPKGGVLVHARHINDEGQITGNMIDSTSGNNVVFIATPRRGHRHVASEGAE